jgi:bifunctional UDP-N-acetylglucosamine pyrophosphorylase/glucosamine-1-phosphate N-acetyltransferase
MDRVGPFYRRRWSNLYDHAVTVVVILAAGQGTRMRSETPKLLHPLCGRPMIAWPVCAAREAGASKVVVVDNPQRRLESVLGEDVAIAIQEEPRGTADAVRAGAEGVATGQTVVVLAGDVPLITAETIRALAAARQRRSPPRSSTTPPATAE